MTIALWRVLYKLIVLKLAWELIKITTRIIKETQVLLNTRV